MTKREARRQELLEILASHILEHGLAAASLRSLAARAETSDRMLLYYFEDKEDLIAAVLQTAAARLRVQISAALDPEPQPAAAVIARAYALLASDSIKPYMQLWFELAAAASRNQEPYRSVAAAIAQGFLAWLAPRIAPVRGSSREAQAAAALAAVDGLLLLHATGCADEARKALRVFKASPDAAGTQTAPRPSPRSR